MSQLITVTNVADGDVLTYSLAIIRGTVPEGSNCAAVFVTTSDPEIPDTECLVVDDKFIALYELKQGANGIRLGLTREDLDDETAKNLMLFYEPLPASHPFVRPVYLLAADSDGSFQAPYARRTCTDGVKRLRVASLMLQSALAEMMHAHGFGRRTFSLAPEVLVHRMAKLKLSVAHNTNDGMLLWRVGEESLRSCPRRNDSIDLGVMSFSRMVGGKVHAHTALGGGPLALFGGASLWTWPSRVSDISKCLLDELRFHPMKYFEDSGNRGSLAGLVATTTIGALLHELCHCFSLPHPAKGTAEGKDIMERGFDYFDRIFVQRSTNQAVPGITRGAAVRLRWHRFLQFPGELELRRIKALRISQVQDSPPVLVQPSSAPSSSNSSKTAHDDVEFDIEGIGPSFKRMEDGKVICRARAGIGHIGYCLNGDNAAHEEFVSEVNIPKTFVLPTIDQIRSRCNAGISDDIRVSAIDSNGNIVDVLYNDI